MRRLSLRPSEKLADPLASGLLVAATIALLYDIVTVRHAFYYGVDFDAVYRGAQDLRHAGDPYLTPAFVYPPLAAVALLPFTFVGAHVGAGGLVVTTIAITALAVAAGNLVEGRSVGRFSALTALALAASPNGWMAMATGNLQTAVVAAAFAALLLVYRQRPVWGGLLLGLAIGIKPVVFPFLVVLMLRREWRSTVFAGLAAAVPNVLLLMTLAQPGALLTRVLPRVIHGATVTLADNLSLWAVGQRASGFRPVVVPLDIVVIALAIFAMWRARRCDTPSEAIVVSSAGSLAVFLVTRVDEPFYGLVAVPALLVAALTARTFTVRVSGWIALTLVGVFGSPYTSFLGTHSALIGTTGQVLALVVLVLWVSQRPETRSAERSRRAIVSR